MGQMGQNTKNFIVAPYPANPSAPWKLELRASFAGRRVKRFFVSEAVAYAAGLEMVQKVQSRGVDGLQPDTGVPMAMLCETFVDRQRSKSKSHQDKARQICGMLRQRFVTVDVSAAELESWFVRLPGSETTRAMFYRYTRMFFRWAHRMGYVARDPSAALDAPKAAVGRNILTAGQMKAVLALEMPQWMEACILLGGFAGLRTAELLRMEWADVDATKGEIHIRPGVGKDTGGFLERIVNFTPPLARRKERFQVEGKLVPVSARVFHLARKELARSADLGLDWPDNCLRHSFATYHLAKSKNAGVTAFQMGHTNPSMVQRVYAVPAVRADQAAWWAI